MLAKHVSRDKEIFCSAEMPLVEVYNKMTEIGCVCMPVVESLAHRNIIGTITEHDICQKILNGGLNPQRISAGRVLNSNFTTVSGEATVEECAAVLQMTASERLLVVDENGAFMGILTAQELPSEKTIVSLETVIKDYSLAPALPPKIQLAH